MARCVKHPSWQPTPAGSAFGPGSAPHPSLCPLCAEEYAASRRPPAPPVEIARPVVVSDPRHLVPAEWEAAWSDVQAAEAARLGRAIPGTTDEEEAIAAIDSKRLVDLDGLQDTHPDQSTIGPGPYRRRASKRPRRPRRTESERAYAKLVGPTDE